MKTEIKRDHVGKESLNKCFDWFQIRFLREAIKKTAKLWTLSKPWGEV